jgi:carbon-monoxide dehydrogenase large subunit
MLQMLDYKKFRAEQEAARQQGRLLGIGFSAYIEACSIAPSKLVGALGAGAGLYESGKVRVHPTGGVTVYTGSHSHGQGHETTFAQIVADKLGIPIEQVEIVHGDTGSIPFGMGTYGSRSASVGGTAILMSLNKVIEKGKKIAAHLLEASPGDIEFGRSSSPSRAHRQGGAVWRRVPHRVRAAQLSGGARARARGDVLLRSLELLLPFGAHACVVEVERETGNVRILRYLAVDDVGNVINPMIVDGMVHGGIAQGVGRRSAKAPCTTASRASS